MKKNIGFLNNNWGGRRDIGETYQLSEREKASAIAELAKQMRHSELTWAKYYRSKGMDAMAKNSVRMAWHWHKRLHEATQIMRNETLEGWNEIAEKYAPKKRVLLSENDCDHKGEHAVIGGMRCPACGRRREPQNDFEKRLVSKLTPRDSGYVNYHLR
jgi:hypothetical protein